MQGWQLVQRSANPENIRKEYEFLKRLRETEVMMTRVHPATSFVAKASAVGLFQADAEERYAPQLTGLYLSQSVDCAMTSSDKVSLAGRVKNANGRGDGSFTLAWKKGVSSDLHVQTSASVSVDSVGFSGRISKTLSERVVFILQPSLQYYHTMGVLNPSVMACKFGLDGWRFVSVWTLIPLPSVLTMQLRPSWHGTIALNYGLQDASLTTSIVHTELNQPKAVANLTVIHSAGHV